MELKIAKKKIILKILFRIDSSEVKITRKWVPLLWPFWIVRKAFQERVQQMDSASISKNLCRLVSHAFVNTEI